MSPLQSLSMLREIPDLRERFRELCLHYSGLVRNEGVTFRPFESEELPFFSSLSTERQQGAVEAITVELEIFESMLAEKRSLRDSPRLLWRAMGRMGLVPLPDVFDKIGDEDTVEIYLIDPSGQRQVFRNLRWMEVASYTVEQLVVMDWRILASRDDKFVQQIAQAAMGIMEGRYARTFDPGIEAHLVAEVDSPGLHRVRVKIKYLSPVRCQGRVVGGISINHVELLDRGRDVGL